MLVCAKFSRIPSASGKPDIADPRILIVDDDTAHAASVRDLLAAHQYPAAAISDSTSILAELADHDYHVLLLDLNMPGLTGLEVLEQIQQAAVNVRTIVLSGESKLSTVTPILRLGAHQRNDQRCLAHAARGHPDHDRYRNRVLGRFCQRDGRSGASPADHHQPAGQRP